MSLTRIFEQAHIRAQADWSTRAASLDTLFQIPVSLHCPRLGIRKTCQKKLTQVSRWVIQKYARIMTSRIDPIILDLLVTRHTHSAFSTICFVQHKTWLRVYSEKREVTRLLWRLIKFVAGINIFLKFQLAATRPVEWYWSKNRYKSVFNICKVK
jgi:hypothetical protein